MFEIKENTISSIEIKKSKFIALAIKINDIKEINNILDEIKKEYKGATHYCYAYKLLSSEKFSDDKEPSGTAGLPILEIIKLKNLTNILIVVIRYFGGIKLGSGNLIRAYRNVTLESINKAELIPYIKTKQINISFKYENEKLLKKLEKEYELINKEYNNTIDCIFKVPIEQEENFLQETKKS